MVGRTLAHYRVVEQIGAGGMGVVYRARDERLDRDVALKVLAAGALADETARKRFQQEARALSQLNHPHICTIYDVGEAEGQIYIAMEFIEGRPLNALARGEGLPVDSAIRYGVQIAGALAHAHERGFVHRDLKGANVLITADGRAKVLDFGLARRLPGPPGEATRTQGLTEAGTVVGTLSYMAPEVLRGEPADARSDLWALGVVLYESVSGSLPFSGQGRFEVTSAVLRDSPAPLPPRVPAGLRTVIHRCLAKEPAQRYQRAGEVRAALEAAHSDTTAVAARPPAPAARRWPWIAATAALAMLLAVALGPLRNRLGLGASSARRIESIAVLPLDNTSRDPEQEYFADGMTEQLITDLSKIKALRVISRTSVMQYKGARQPLPEIARALHVDAVVSGSVLRSGNRVRITAQLIHAGSDQHLWAESYERDLRDALALQREVARTIAQEIRATLTPQEKAQLAGGRQVDPEVHRLTLQGRFHANQLTEEPLKKGIRYFEQAIARDPAFAPAYAGLAFAYASMSSYYLAPREVMPKAKEAALKAVQLDETLSDAHAWLGFVLTFYDWDWPAAERELKRALELNPSSADAHLVYGNYLMVMGRAAEAIEEMKRAQQLDPLSLPVRAGPAGAAWVLVNARRYDEAIDQARRALEIDPKFAWAHSLLGIAYGQKGEFSRAIAAYEEGVRQDNSPMLKALLAYGYAQAGRRREAGPLLREIEDTYRTRYLCAYEIATVHLALGDKDRALEWLNKALGDRADCIPWMNVDPRLESLRSDPRFQEMLERVALAPRRRP